MGNLVSRNNYASVGIAQFNSSSHVPQIIGDDQQYSARDYWEKYMQKDKDFSHR